MSRLLYSGMLEGVMGGLTVCRGAEVDKSQPETEPSWFLSGTMVLCTLHVFYGLHRLWRFLAIQNIPMHLFSMTRARILL